MLSFWHGIAVGAISGLAVGLVVGIAWADSYHMIKEAFMSRRKMEGGFWNESRVTVVIGAILAVVLGIIGTLQVVTYAQFTSYQKCSAKYDQQSAEARAPRLEASTEMDRALYVFLLSTRRVVDPEKPATPAEVKRFTSSLDKWIEKYEAQVETQETNPYPDEPEKVCGTP